MCVHRRRNLFDFTCWNCVFFTISLTVIGILGAMLLFFIESGSFGGVSFFGSVVLIPLLMPVVGKLFGLKLWQTMDICGPCVAIMIGCMRVNCFLSGCCGGWEIQVYDICFAWPTQIMDSIGDFAIASWLIKWEASSQKRGGLYPLFMVSYGIMRFILEFLRNTPKDWLYLSHGQWFSAISIAAGLTWFLCIKYMSASHTSRLALLIKKGKRETL